MSDTPQELLRTTFDQVAELYDRARPNYPTQIFDDLAALAQLPVKARLVEIGCGTGQATLTLAQRGYAITCVELGERLAATAQRKLATFPSVSVINANFETWQPARRGFDAVVAFSAFHWLAPDLRYAKTTDLLRERGKLGFVSTAHVLPDDGDPLFIEVQADYDAVIPDDPKTNAGAGRAFYSAPWRQHLLTPSGTRRQGARTRARTRPPADRGAPGAGRTKDISSPCSTSPSGPSRRSLTKRSEPPVVANPKPITRALRRRVTSSTQSAPWGHRGRDALPGGDALGFVREQFAHPPGR